MAIAAVVCLPARQSTQYGTASLVLNIASRTTGIQYTLAPLRSSCRPDMPTHARGQAWKVVPCRRPWCGPLHKAKNAGTGTSQAPKTCRRGMALQAPGKKTRRMKQTRLLKGETAFRRPRAGKATGLPQTEEGSPVQF